MPDYFLITAKFAGTCSECGGKTDEGDKLLWAKGYGAKHEECPEEIDDVNEPVKVIGDDFETWKDPKIYSYKDVQPIKNCQCCGRQLTGMDKFLRGDDGVGFRAVCEEHS
jgi:hypothetical protein